jgi:hypothetical protein
MSKARKLDQFYTAPDVAAECVAQLDARMGIFSSYCEPSAGRGAFLQALKGRSWEAFDLDPKFMGVKRQDFLSAICAAPCVIGNPPFGKNSSLAVKFFNHAASFLSTKVIGMILPKTFRKSTIQNRLHRAFHLVYDQEVGEGAFIFEGATYDVPCCFQIWERKATPRKSKKHPVTSPWFTFVTEDSADFAIRRVGALAGKIIKEFHGYATSSHYYIKCKNKKVAAAFTRINFVKDTQNTAGCPSLSKSEICAAIAKEMGNA